VNIRAAAAMAWLGLLLMGLMRMVALFQLLLVGTFLGLDLLGSVQGNAVFLESGKTVVMEESHIILFFVYLKKRCNDLLY